MHQQFITIGQFILSESYVEYKTCFFFLRYVRQLGGFWNEAKPIDFFLNDKPSNVDGQINLILS